MRYHYICQFTIVLGLLSTSMYWLFLIISAMMAQHHRCYIMVAAYALQPSRHRWNNWLAQTTNVKKSTSCLMSDDADKQNQQQNNSNEDNGGDSSYQTSGSVIKGIVSSLTSLTNAILQTTPRTTDEPSNNITLSPISHDAPTSPQELLTRISNDYRVNNYLWTGNLDISCFTCNCTFTDPTLSFVGVAKYAENVRNLIPIVNYLLGDDDDEEHQSSSRSDLLSITINDTDKYIETRWNMVGNLTKLFWKPRIDVIGRTKFWYQQIPKQSREKIKGDDSSTEEESIYQVYFYDEQWEISAGLALLQLVTRAGTIANTNKQ